MKLGQAHAAKLRWFTKRESNKSHRDASRCRRRQRRTPPRWHQYVPAHRLRRRVLRDGNPEGSCHHHPSGAPSVSFLLPWNSHPTRKDCIAIEWYIPSPFSRESYASLLRIELGWLMPVEITVSTDVSQLHSVCCYYVVGFNIHFLVLACSKVVLSREKQLCMYSIHKCTIWVKTCAARE